MSWRDDVRAEPASFRGVPFFLEQSSTKLGRRREAHVIAGTAEVVPQDLGPQPRSFTVSAFVLGDDYLAQRERLEAALDDEGPGELVLPLRGRLQAVVAGEVTVTESKDRGGYARFEIPFIEVTLTLHTYWASEAATTARASAQAAHLVAQTAAESTLALEAASTEARVDLAEGIADTAAVIEGPLVRLGASAGGGSPVRAKASFLRADPLAHRPAELISRARECVTAPFDAVRARAADLLEAPESVDAELRTLVDALSSACRGFFRLERPRFAGPLWPYIRAAFTFALAETLPALRLDSYDQAMRLRRDVADAFDEIEGELDDTTFAAAQATRVAALTYLETAASERPRLRTFVVPSEMPALLIAHLVYGDARRESDVIARNPAACANPALVPAGSILEVLDG